MSGASTETEDNNKIDIPYERLSIWLCAREIEPLENYQLTDDSIFHDYALSFFIEKYEKILSLSVSLWHGISAKNLDGNMRYLILSFTDIPGLIKEMIAAINCPLSHEALLNPRLASDGHTYESGMIKPWLRSSGTSPVTAQPISQYLEVNTPLISAFWRYFDPDELEDGEFEDVWPEVLYKISQDEAFCQQDI